MSDILDGLRSYPLFMYSQVWNLGQTYFLPPPPSTLRHPHPCVVRAASNSVGLRRFFSFKMMRHSGCCRLTKPFAEAIIYGTFRIYVMLFFCPSAIIQVFYWHELAFLFLLHPQRRVPDFSPPPAHRGRKKAVMALMAPSPSSNVFKNAKMHLSM